MLSESKESSQLEEPPDLFREEQIVFPLKVILGLLTRQLMLSKQHLESAMGMTIIDKGSTTFLITISTLHTLHLMRIEYTSLPILFLILCKFLVEVHILSHFHHYFLGGKTVAPSR